MIRTDEEDKFVTLVENPWSSTVRGDQAGWEHIAHHLGPQRLASREPMTNTEQHTEKHTQGPHLYAAQIAELSEAFQATANAQAVRDFLRQSMANDVHDDIIDEMIKKESLTSLDVLQFLNVEDLSDPVKSIISPKVIPILHARKLIQQSIPRMVQTLTHGDNPPLGPQGLAPVRIEVSSPATHAELNAEHVHGPMMPGNTPLMSANPPGVSPTIPRGAIQPLMTHLGPDRVVPWGVCGHCFKQDATVALSRVGPTHDMPLCRVCYSLLQGTWSSSSSSHSGGSNESDGWSVSTRSSRRSWAPALDEDGIPDGHHAPPPSLRSQDLDLSWGGTHSRTRGMTVLVAAVQKQAPSLPVDKHGRLLLTGASFEHYMDTVPTLAQQLDDLPGEDRDGGSSLAEALRYSQQHPRVPPNQVPTLQRARESVADRLLFQILQPGLKDVWHEIPVDIRQHRSSIDLFRYFVSLKPRNQQGELKALRDQVMNAGHPDGGAEAD